MLSALCRSTAKQLGVLATHSKQLPMVAGVQVPQCCAYSSSSAARGWAEFLDQTKGPNDVVVTGRAWTAPDLRRKDFDDLHSLWWVLYKERNLLLSAKEKVRRTQRPYTAAEEQRYTKVKRSMAAIKLVMSERRKIGNLIARKEGDRERSLSSNANANSTESNSQI
jgi:large subunit ribosomal protein L47